MKEEVIDCYKCSNKKEPSCQRCKGTGKINATYEKDSLEGLCKKVRNNLNEHEDQQVDITELDAKPPSVNDATKYKVKLESESFEKNHEVKRG